MVFHYDTRFSVQVSPQLSSATSSIASTNVLLAFPLPLLTTSCYHLYTVPIQHTTQHRIWLRKRRRAAQLHRRGTPSEQVKTRQKSRLTDGRFIAGLEDNTNFTIKLSYCTWRVHSHVVAKNSAFFAKICTTNTWKVGDSAFNVRSSRKLSASRKARSAPSSSTMTIHGDLPDSCSSSILATFASRRMKIYPIAQVLRSW